MQLVSNFGDIAVLLPASLGLIAFLAWRASRRDAAAYAAAMTACLTAALFAKLTFAACGERSSLFDVQSPSGHAAFSATFYGCLAVLFSTGRATGPRLALYGAAAALVMAIGASRVALGAHDLSEVVVRVLIGAASVALFAALRVSPERLELSSRRAFQASPFVALYLVGVLLLAGRWTAEGFFDVLAMRLGEGVRLCR